MAFFIWYLREGGMGVRKRQGIQRALPSFTHRIYQREGEQYSCAALERICKKKPAHPVRNSQTFPAGALQDTAASLAAPGTE